MLTKHDYINLLLIAKAAKLDGYEQALLVVQLVQKLEALLSSMPDGKLDEKKEDKKPAE